MSASRRSWTLGTIKAHLSFANVMASAALFIALGGASYAAVSLPKNSVGSKQVRAHSLQRGDLAAGSVGTRQLRRRSVSAPKLANGGVTKRSLSSWIRGQLRRRAAPGPPGPAGPAGPPRPGRRGGPVLRDRRHHAGIQDRDRHRWLDHSGQL